MTSLNDVLGKVSLPTPRGVANDIRSQVSTSIRATSNEIRNIPNQIAQAGVSQVRGAVSAGLNAGITDIRGAAVQALSGDFSGALTTLAKGPQDILGSFGAAFGLGGGAASFGQSAATINTLQGALGRADPMLSFQWYCELPAITPIGGSPATLDWNYVEEVTAPFRNYNTRDVYGQGRNRKFVSTYSVEGLRLNFYADVGNQSMNYLRAWDGAILAPFGSKNITTGGGFGRPSDHQKPIRIYLVDSAKALVLMLEYVECWPTNIDSLQLDSGSSNRLTFGVNFSVGDVFMTAFGVNTNISGKSFLSALTGKAVNFVTDSITNSVRSSILGI
jgi:hypothetical protein